MIEKIRKTVKAISVILMLTMFFLISTGRAEVEVEEKPAKDLGMIENIGSQKEKVLIEFPEVGIEVVAVETKPEPKPQPVVKEVEIEEKKIEQVSHEVQKESVSSEEVVIMSKIISAEARSEPYKGKVAVGSVIMNRVKSGSFPNSIKGVVFQPGQFSPVTDGSYNRKPNEDSIRAAKEVINGSRNVPSGVLYFYNPTISTDGWIRTTVPYKHIGNHLFAYPPS